MVAEMNYSFVSITTATSQYVLGRRWTKSSLAKYDRHFETYQLCKIFLKITCLLYLIDSIQKGGDWQTAKTQLHLL